jgi:hypothetical protein
MWWAQSQYWYRIFVEACVQWGSVQRASAAAVAAWTSALDLVPHADEAARPREALAVEESEVALADLVGRQRIGLGLQRAGGRQDRPAETPQRFPQPLELVRGVPDPRGSRRRGKAFRLRAAFGRRLRLRAGALFVARHDRPR